MERGAQNSVWLQLSTLYSTTKEFPVLISSLVVRLALRGVDLITASRSAADTHRPKVLPLLDFSRDQPAHRLTHRAPLPASRSKSRAWRQHNTVHLRQRASVTGSCLCAACRLLWFSHAQRQGLFAHTATQPRAAPGLPHSLRWPRHGCAAMRHAPLQLPDLFYDGLGLGA